MFEQTNHQRDLVTVSYEKITVIKVVDRKFDISRL